jgi:predicted class III extradiol MEMO1 family dioxygenase
MRCRILKEGRSYKRWEYILEFDEPFKTHNFVGALNDAFLGIEKYQNLIIDSSDFHHYLVNDNALNSKKYAEFIFTPLVISTQALVCVKRLEMQRVDLHDCLETLLGYDFNKKKVSPIEDNQLKLNLD